MVNKSPKPPALLQMLPPMFLADTTGNPYPDPEPPLVSELWGRVRALADQATDPTRPLGAEAVVRLLRALDEGTWLRVVADAQSWNRYRAGQLLADPALEPNKVERAKKISRLLYGLPWWLREAHFWREAKGADKQAEPQTKTSSIRGEAEQVIW
jgi:hypothetical protein